MASSIQESAELETAVRPLEEGVAIR